MLKRLRRDVAELAGGFVSAMVLAACWAPVIAIPVLVLVAVFGPK